MTVPIPVVMSNVVVLSPAPSDDARYYEYLCGLGLKAKTIADYMRAWRRADQWCRLEGHDLGTAPASVIARYTLQTPNSAASRTHLRIALARYWEMIERDRAPVKAVKVPPAPRGFCRALDEDQASTLAAYAYATPGRESLATLTGLYLGLRVNEIAELHWQRFEAGWGFYRCQGKFDRVREVPLNARYAARLRQEPDRVGYVFAGSRSRAHVHPTTVWGWVKTQAVEAGIGPIHTHRLRHTAIARINDETGDLRTAQEFAGHSKPETTAIYTRTTRTRLQAAAAVLDY